jgi:hypothetical protein
MYGELKDLHELGEWGDLYDKCTAIAGTIMFVALGIFIFFYMFLRPSRWLENDRYTAGLAFHSHRHLACAIFANCVDSCSRFTISPIQMCNRWQTQQARGWIQ